METFSQWLENELRNKGWSPSDLARRMGTHVGTITRVLNGNRNPGPDFCRAVARALGYPQTYVFLKAGLLTESPNDLSDNPLLQRLSAEIQNLTPEEQELLLAFLDALVQRRERHRRPSTKPKEAQA